MEVIIGFTKDDDFTLLRETLESWDACADVIAIECNPKKYEIARRVAADKMAKGKFYFLADIGCTPFDQDSLRRLRDLPPDVAIMGLTPFDAGYRPCKIVGTVIGTCPSGCDYCDYIRELSNAPTGVRLIRKGAIEKWPLKTTITYDKEHADAARLAQFNVALCQDILYKHPQVH